MRVHEYAKEHDLESSTVSEALAALVEAGTLPEETKMGAMSNLDEAEIAALDAHFAEPEETSTEDDPEVEEPTEQDDEDVVPQPTDEAEEPAEPCDEECEVEGCDEECSECDWCVQVKGSPESVVQACCPDEAIEKYNALWGIIKSPYRYKVKKA